MNPDAKVKMNDIQVGSVAAIDQRPDGSAALHLAMNRSELHLIPSNVKVDIASSTVFGAKFVQLTPPTDPSTVSMRAGQVIEGEHVTVEINTIFEQLTSLLSTIQPEKLNQTLTALSSAFSGRGQTIGHAISDLHATLVELDPSLQNLSHDIATAPTVLNTYADVAADLLKITDRFTSISRTIVEEQHDLDELLVSVIGFGDIGNDVLTTNHRPLTDVLHLLAPVTDLTREYDQAIYCALAGAIPLAMVAPPRVPGAEVSASFRWGADPYRYPSDLPKVAATGGPQCLGLPDFPSRRGHRTSSPMSAPTRGNTAMRGYGSTRRASRSSCWAIPSTGRPAIRRRLVCRDDPHLARPAEIRRVCGDHGAAHRRVVRRLRRVPRWRLGHLLSGVQRRFRPANRRLRACGGNSGRHCHRRGTAPGSEDGRRLRGGPHRRADNGHPRGGALPQPRRRPLP